MAQLLTVSVAWSFPIPPRPPVILMLAMVTTVFDPMWNTRLEKAPSTANCWRLGQRWSHSYRPVTTKVVNVILIFMVFPFCFGLADGDEDRWQWFHCSGHSCSHQTVRNRRAKPISEVEES